MQWDCRDNIWAGYRRIICSSWTEGHFSTTARKNKMSKGMNI